MAIIFCKKCRSITGNTSNDEDFNKRMVKMFKKIHKGHKMEVYK